MKRKKGHRHFSWFSIILIGIILYFGSILVSQRMYLNQVADEQAAAETRLAAAREENAQLQQEKENLSNLSYIEKIAREELGMTRQGELPYSTGRKDAK